jgi:minor extracellular serine protease Vpr
MNSYVPHPVKALALLLLAAGVALPQGRPERYALILEDAPVAAAINSRKDLQTKAAVDQRQAIAARQQSVRAALEERRIRVTGSVQTLANAVFVQATPAEAAELEKMPGVAYVDKLERLKWHMSGALQIIRASQAWAAIRGGESSAGAGVKIGILDTGIDQTHPAFQDNSLQIPAGFPKCQGSDCDFTNRKVIVARSYVNMLVLGDQPEFSRPDDLSPRDRVGHGTGSAMIAAGARVQTPVGTITSGVAPKAYLGNYKIFGSPGVNDVTFEDALVKALDDAFNDQMDVVSVALGSQPLYSILDRGRTCGREGTQPCDWRADAIENATKSRMAVVVSAGNDGDLGSKYPYNSITTPGIAPSAITVGATTNLHIYYNSVRVPDGPTSLRRINALFGNGPRPGSPLSAPLRDVARLGNDGLACTALPNGSLNGAIALILRGDCSRDTKVNNAQKAGAVGVIMYQWEGSESPIVMRDLSLTAIPAVMIGNRNGLLLKDLAAVRPDVRVTLDPQLEITQLPNDADLVAFFSSQGPSHDLAIKPELVAVGTDLYVATQKFDPNGDMFDTTGWTAVQGTSFAAPMVAGAVALVKQVNPGMEAAHLKSAVVNTADPRIDEIIDANGRTAAATVRAVGAGRLDVEQAVKTTITVQPATLSFGAATTNPLPARALEFRNWDASRIVQLTLRATGQGADRLRFSPSTVPAIGPGRVASISVSLASRPTEPGAYEGDIIVTGGSVELHVPYLYVVGDNVPANVLPIRGNGFVADQDASLRLGIKVTDRFGVPVANVPVRWRLVGGDIDRDTVATEGTNPIGVAWADTYAPQEIGEHTFVAEVGTGEGKLVHEIPGRVRARPSIFTGGVVNAASNQAGRGLAPGSIISIYGRALSEATQQASLVPLPLSMSGVSVSFDQPERRVSVPGRLFYVGESQINVQIPWEMQGASSVQMKVSIEDSSSSVYTVPLLDYSPALFEWTEPGTNRQFAVAQDSGFRLITSDNGAQRGQVILLYANGLGPVDNQPASGEAAAGAPRLATARVVPEVTIGERPAPVSFAGLTPGSVGLYQINVQVPADLAPGVHPVVVTSNGIISKTTSLPIR